MSEVLKVSVTYRAILQRMNRVLKKQNRQIWSCRVGHLQYDKLGDYYIIDTEQNCLVEMKVDVFRLAQELKVIKPYEVLEVLV